MDRFLPQKPQKSVTLKNSLPYRVLELDGQRVNL